MFTGIWFKKVLLVNIERDRGDRLKQSPNYPSREGPEVNQHCELIPVSKVITSFVGRFKQKSTPHGFTHRKKICSRYPDKHLVAVETSE